MPPPKDTHLNLLRHIQPLHQAPILLPQPRVVQPDAKAQRVAQVGVLHLPQGGLWRSGRVCVA